MEPISSFRDRKEDLLKDISDDLHDIKVALTPGEPPPPEVARLHFAGIGAAEVKLVAVQAWAATGDGEATIMIGGQWHRVTGDANQLVDAHARWSEID